MTANSLKGKRALVTGASAGIGYETAAQLAENGVEVWALARRKERLAGLQKKYPSVILVEQDLLHDLSPLKERIRDVHFDILINNAGLAVGREPIQSTEKSAWQTMFHTNVESLIEISQMLIPKMIEKGSGDIINLGSTAAYNPYGGGSVYCATKAAVKMLTESWRIDLLGTGVRVMAIHPGMVETEFSEVRFGGDKELAKKVYDGMNPLHAEDIADSIIWTLSRPRHVSIQSLLIMPTDQAGAREIYRRKT